MVGAGPTSPQRTQESQSPFGLWEVNIVASDLGANEVIQTAVEILDQRIRCAVNHIRVGQIAHLGRILAAVVELQVRGGTAEALLTGAESTPASATDNSVGTRSIAPESLSVDCPAGIMFGQAMVSGT